MEFASGDGFLVFAITSSSFKDFLSIVVSLASLIDNDHVQRPQIQGPCSSSVKSQEFQTTCRDEEP
jgi:hypothetical protein